MDEYKRVETNDRDGNRERYKTVYSLCLRERAVSLCTLYSHVQMHFKATCSRFLEIKRSYVLVHPTKRNLLLMGFKIFLQESITSEKIHITKNE